MMTLRIMAFNTMALRIMTFSIPTLSIMAFRNRTLRILTFSIMTLSKTTNKKEHSA
jgi:hypothetical protein